MSNHPDNDPVLTKEYAAEVTDLPRPEPNGCTGYLFSEGHSGALTYMSWDGNNPPVFEWPVVRFTDGVHARAFAQNDQARGNNPYSDLWHRAGVLFIAEIKNSRFARECDRQSDMYRQGFDDNGELRHLIFLFKENTVEIVAREFLLHSVCRSFDEAREAMLKCFGA